MIFNNTSFSYFCFQTVLTSKLKNSKSCYGKSERYWQRYVSLLITLLFVDFTGMLHTWLGWLAKIQFLPAVLALNAGVILFLVVLTLVSGRIYCSVICPLGIFQDIVARIGRRKKKMPYSYSKPKWHCFGIQNKKRRGQDGTTCHL